MQWFSACLEIKGSLVRVSNETSCSVLEQYTFILTAEYLYWFSPEKCPDNSCTLDKNSCGFIIDESYLTMDVAHGMRHIS